MPSGLSKGAVLVGGGIVLLVLGTGHLLLALGRSASKSNESALLLMQMKLVDVVVSVFSTILISYSFSNGGENSNTFIGNDHYATTNVNSYSLWFYQCSLLIVALSFISNISVHLVETLLEYSFFAFFFASIVYPIIFHWTWSSSGWASPFRSSYRDNLLNGCGLLDSGGAIVLYYTTACTALILTFFKPIGLNEVVTKVDMKLNKLKVMFHNTCNIIGIVLVWAGSVGYYCINNLPTNLNTIEEVIGMRAINSSLGPGTTIAITLFLLKYYNSNHHESFYLRHVANATISSLVAISSSNSVVNLEGSFAVGFASAFLYYFVYTIHQRYFRQPNQYSVEFNQDVQLLICVFVFAIFSIIATGFLASHNGYILSLPSGYDYINSADNSDNNHRVNACTGVFYGGNATQLGTNVAVVLSVTAFVVPVVIMYRVVIHPSLMNIVTHLTRGSVVKVTKNDLYDAKANVTVTTTQPVDEPSEIAIPKVIESETLSFGLNSDNRPVEDFMSTEEFEAVNGYSWDYVIVLPAIIPSDDNKETPNRGDCAIPPETIRIINSLQKYGLETYNYLSVQKDEVYVKIRADLKRVMFQADIENMKVLLDEDELMQVTQKGFRGVINDKVIQVKPFLISRGEEHTSIRPYQYIYAPFDYDDYKINPNLYAKLPENNGKVISEVLRLKLIDRIITGSGIGCCNFQIKRLMSEGKILGYFPLHKDEKLKELADKWLDWGQLPWKQPNGIIKCYFGERVAYYFMFLAFYITWLIPLAFAGLLVTLHGVILSITYGSVVKAFQELYSLPFFCLSISIWTNLFLVNWESNSSYHALKWGMIDAEEVELEREEYIGVVVPSHITGKPIKQYPKKEKKRAKFISNMLVTVFITMVIVLLGLVFYLKFRLRSNALSTGESSDVEEFALVLADGVNAFQIQLFQYLFNRLARYLCKRENHRTDTEFRDSLILKLFAFNFVNSYLPLFYIAFMKKAIGDQCYRDSCMTELSKSMCIIFISRLFIGNITTYAIPRIKRYIRELKESKNVNNNKKMTPNITDILANNSRKLKESVQEMNVMRTATELRDSITSLGDTIGGAILNNVNELKHEMENMIFFDRNKFSEPEKQFMLESYDENCTQDYNEISIQFGYITLFASATPFSPFFALISNYIECRSDGWKLLTVFRRPFCKDGEDIGSWEAIFQIFSFISIFTNVGIILYTSDIFTVTSTYVRLWLAFCFIFFAFTLRHITARTFTLHSSGEADIQIKRQNHIISKIFDRVPDEDEELDQQNMNRKLNKLNERRKRMTINQKDTIKPVQ